MTAFATLRSSRSVLPFTSNGARLVEAFLATAEHKGDDDAIVTAGGQAISYAALSRCSAVRAQAYADSGIGTGDVVLVAHCLGSVAAQNLLETTETIGRLRGSVHQFRGVKVVCTYHPAYLLRNPSAKKQTWEDMKLLMRELGTPVE